MELALAATIRAMSEPPDDKVVDLSTQAKREKARRSSRKSKANGVTLCRRGFHKWADEPRKQFDVKQGKLVSMQRCTRCGSQKVRTS